jgi:hypothetical protein
MESSEFESIMAKGYNKEKLEIQFHQHLLDSTDWKEHVIVTYSLDLTRYSFICLYEEMKKLPIII